MKVVNFDNYNSYRENIANYFPRGTANKSLIPNEGLVIYRDR